MRLARTVAVFFVAMGLAVMGILAIAPLGFVSPPLFFNVTASLPRGFYRVEIRDTLRKGDYIRTCVPENAAAFALQRGYLTPGSCPGGTTPIGKRVVALPGDTVHVTRQGVYIRRRALAHSVPQSMDRKGRPVSAAFGEHVLGKGECFVVSTYNERSYDSRYFGPVTCKAPFYVLRSASRRARNLLNDG